MRAIIGNYVLGEAFGWSAVQCWRQERERYCAEPISGHPAHRSNLWSIHDEVCRVPALERAADPSGRRASTQVDGCSGDEHHGSSAHQSEGRPRHNAQTACSSRGSRVTVTASASLLTYGDTCGVFLFDPRDTQDPGHSDVVGDTCRRRRRSWLRSPLCTAIDTVINICFRRPR